MVCKNCQSFKVFGEKCWYYWQKKSACSQHAQTLGEEPKYKEKE